MTRPLTPDEFQGLTNVSRETLDRLKAYLALLEKWQKRINLVGRGSMSDPWRRHFLDSAQLLHLHGTENPSDRWVDLGSGAGFPGLVLAILGAANMNLIEADTRKCVFLTEAARLTNTPISVHAVRIEKLANLGANIITARAVADLSQLIDYGRMHAAPGANALFLKGRHVKSEIQHIEEGLTNSSKYRKVSIETTISQSDPSGFVVRVKGFSLNE